jgi:hypothetical protein
MIDYGGEGNFEKLPKVGDEPKVFEIDRCERIDNPNYKYNFKKTEQRILDDGTEASVQVNLGYRYEFYLKNGKSFSLNSWKPFFAFKEANVQDGDKIRVSHPAEGEWKVEVLNRGQSTSGEDIKQPDPIDPSEVAWDE